MVKRCGRPTVHLTMMSPQRDQALQCQVRQERVLTIFPASRGHGTDYGVVGLLKGRGVQLLVFPKSLRRFQGKRIVGIDYSLLAGEAATAAGDTGAGFWRLPHRAKPRPRPDDVKAIAPPPKPEPATMQQVLATLQTIRLQLKTRKYPVARTDLDRLIDAVRNSLSEKDAAD